MDNADWGVTGCAIVIALLDVLEKKKILSDEEGREVVAAAVQWLAKTAEQKQLWGQPEAVDRLIEIYKGAVLRAGKNMEAKS